MRRFVAAAAVALTLACGSDGSTTPTNTAIAGTYSLQTINGSALPFTFVSGTDSLTVTADTILVGSDGTWSESVAYRQTVGGQVTTGTQIDGGVWLANDTQVEFDSTVSGLLVYTGTFTNSALNLTDGSTAQVFVR